ncbi:hypothetical protein BaRGS_00025855, partial [Batillaria attramentaria]
MKDMNPMDPKRQLFEKERGPDNKTSDLKDQAKDFISSTTAHGLKNVFEKERGIARSQRYHQLPFPHLTVCNLNPLDLTKLPSESAAALQSIADPSSPYLSSSGNSSYNFTGGDQSILTDASSAGLFDMSQVPVDEFFTSCEYEQEKNCSRLFTAFQLGYDRCYVLNTKELPSATRRTSLKLTIFVNEAGYASDIEEIGVKFHVHDPGETPDMMVSHHRAATGFKTNVALRLHEYKYLPPPYKAFGDKSCTDTETAEFRRLMDSDPPLYYGSQGQEYSLDACLNGRSNKMASDICQCSVGSDQTYRPCTTSDILTCYGLTTARLLDEGTSSGDFLGCPRPCHSYSYKPVVSSSYFPSPRAEARLRSLNIVGNVTNIRTNYLQLNFYYEDLTIQTTEHVPQYDWNSILGLLGGNMGFFLGASVLTLAELLDFIACVVMALLRKMWTCGRPRSQLLVKFFWFVLFTSALVVLTIMMYNSYLVIVSYPFRTVTTLNMTSSLEFPAVTICNKNPIDKKMPENETGSAYKGKGGMEKYLALPDVEVDDFFTHCQYGTDDKNCSEILVPFTLLSERCFVLRPKKLHKATRRMPLKLTVFVNRAAYRLHAHAVGVKFHVHAPVDVPDMSMPRSVAPPGYVTNVAMRKTEYEFLPSPYTAFGDSKCTDTTTEEFREEMAANPENYFYQLTGHYKGYSVENCVAARAGRQAVKECNCTLSTLESEYNLCTFSDMKNCFISTSSRLLELAEAGDLLGCPRPCHSEEYLTVVSTSYFPSPPVEDELIKAGVIGNVSDIRANYLQLEFYYEDLRVHKTMHVAEYGDWQSIL